VLTALAGRYSFDPQVAYLARLWNRCLAPISAASHAIDAEPFQKVFHGKPWRARRSIEKAVIIYMREIATTTEPNPSSTPEVTYQDVAVHSRAAGLGHDDVRRLVVIRCACQRKFTVRVASRQAAPAHLAPNMPTTLVGA
jgi:hypothetical protein